MSALTTLGKKCEVERAEEDEVAKMEREECSSEIVKYILIL